MSRSIGENSTRREFLKQAAVGGALALMSSHSARPGRERLENFLRIDAHRKHLKLKVLRASSSDALRMTIFSFGARCEVMCLQDDGAGRAGQLLMSDLVSSLASMGSRKGLLASGAPAMASFISLEAEA
jgi:hypothetical protein